MSVSGVGSSNGVSSHTPPQPPVQQQAAAQAKAPAPIKVDISKQAQQLANDGDPAALENQESSMEKAGEARKGKA
jgi:hypothetical protein